MLEDQELIRRLQAGDTEALRQIYLRHKDDLLTVAACILADPAAAEDSLHDVMVSLADHATGLELRGSLKGYLVTSVANRARDELRKRARRNGQAASASAPPESDPPDWRPDPVTRASDQEQEDQLYQALAGLPSEQRSVVTLHLHGDLTFDEIALQEGVPSNTVRSRYRYALDKLRALFGAEVKL